MIQGCLVVTLSGSDGNKRFGRCVFGSSALDAVLYVTVDNHRALLLYHIPGTFYNYYPSEIYLVTPLV